MTRKLTAAFILALLLALFAPGAMAGDSPDTDVEVLSADWFVIAGGGASDCTGGEFSLGGTIGQHAADTLTGGEFTLEGGFWRGVPVCTCYGDLNGDGVTNGKDVRNFVRCMLHDFTIDCTCADSNKDFAVDLNDISAFVTGLLNGPACD